MPVNAYERSRRTDRYDSPFLLLFSARLALNGGHERYRGSQLGGGDPASPGHICLVLLHSCPDTVRKGPPHGGPHVNTAYHGLLHNARTRGETSPLL